MLLDAGRSQLLLVDVQERLMPAMHEAERVVEGCGRLVEAACTLGVPATVSEQYPRGLGATVPQLAERLGPEVPRFAKTHFSCAGDAAILGRLAAAGRPQVVLAGVEAHVCVLQTALQLKAMGFQPAVVWDAVASRTPESRELARERLGRAGVDLVNGEMVLFEWLQRAGTPAFKALSGLLK